MAARVEIHETTQWLSARRSRRLEGGVAVPAGATVVFARGGLSLRLFDWRGNPRHWSRIPLTLRFADASEAVSSAELRQ